jgi:hypothetical protein
MRLLLLSNRNFDLHICLDDQENGNMQAAVRSSNVIEVRLDFFVSELMPYVLIPLD